MLLSCINAALVTETKILKEKKTFFSFEFPVVKFKLIAFFERCNCYCLTLAAKMRYEKRSENMALQKEGKTRKNLV